MWHAPCHMTCPVRRCPMPYDIPCLNAPLNFHASCCWPGACAFPHALDLLPCLPTPIVPLASVLFENQWWRFPKDIRWPRYALLTNVFQTSRGQLVTRGGWAIKGHRVLQAGGQHGDACGRERALIITPCLQYPSPLDTPRYLSWKMISLEGWSM
jgi:hypothetical protein